MAARVSMWASLLGEETELICSWGVKCSFDYSFIVSRLPLQGTVQWLTMTFSYRPRSESQNMWKQIKTEPLSLTLTPYSETDCVIGLKRGPSGISETELYLKTLTYITAIMAMSRYICKSFASILYRLTEKKFIVLIGFLFLLFNFFLSIVLFFSSMAQLYYSRYKSQIKRDVLNHRRWLRTVFKKIFMGC